MAPERLTTFTNDSYTFDVIDSGPIDGIPVVLLHGFPQRASSWSAVSEHLHAAGFRTYAPDQRGYSLHARPKTRFGYRSSSLVADVLALIDQIGPGPVHLVGHDWGSAVGWALAGKHPGRVSSYTAVSVGHPAAFLKSMVRSNQALKSYYVGLFQIPWLPERIMSGKRADSFLLHSGMDKDMVADFKRDIVEYGALTGGLGWYRAMPLSKPGEIKRKTSVPTTYVWSDGDVALGRKAADLTADLVTGPYEFVVIEGATHWLPDQHPERLAEIIIQRINA